MFRPGMMIGDRYEILETVGSGGMSVVYKAKCHKLNRYVAIKVLKPEFSDDKSFVTKFRVEAQSAAGLSHPNIVNVFDVGDDEGVYYIVMELVEGITLKEYVQQNGRLPVGQAIDFAIQIASGIAVAHDNHIIHRDIKPQNIIVSRNGTLKVTDFGIAKAATSNTVASNAMGSVHYISPEQARGGYSDERSDIYSLGITMYEMLTGRVPFEGENNVSVALMHIQGEMIPPRQYYPEIPASLEKVILKCTQKKPERRYLTANGLIADLKQVAANPNADLVVASSSMVNSDAPTVVMSDDELNAIKNGTALRDAEPETEAEMQEEVQGLQVFPVDTGKGQPTENFDSLWDDDLSYENDEDEDEDEDEDDDIDIDDDASDLDPKLEKIIRVGGIVAAVIIGIIIMLIFGKMTNWFHFGKTTTEDTQAVEQVEMINVVGMTQEEAEAALKEGNIPYTITMETSDVMEEGYVIKQSYEKGDMLAAGESVVITVSSGQEPVEVPDVVGWEDDRACTVLEEAGFKVTHSYEYNENVDKDKVISTNPKAGEKLVPGSSIVVTVSNGPEVTEVTVPSLKGLTVLEAEAKLNENGLKLGNTTQEYSDAAVGTVISQSTSADTKVSSGTTVDITISKGPEETVVTYTAAFSGLVTNNGYTFAEGETASVKVAFKYGNISYTLIDGTYSAGQFPIDLSTVEKISGLSSNSGSLTVSVISSTGQDISSNFGASSATISYTEVEQ